VQGYLFCWTFQPYKTCSFVIQYILDMLNLCKTITKIFNFAILLENNQSFL
jgi:hypothetical protein